MNEKLKARILEIAAKHDPIQIKCEGAATLPLDVIADFQGDLKKLSNDNMIRLVTSLFLNGFCAPFFVWKREGDYYALDGHQRVKALCAIREAGLPIPGVFPVAFIDAVDEQDARKKLLAITSQYGDVQRDELKEWLEEIEEEAREAVRLLSGELPVFAITEQDGKDVKTEKLEPYEKVHVLLTMDQNVFFEVQEVMKKIKAIEGVEYEQPQN